MCIKSDFIAILLKLATNRQSDKAFILTSHFVPKEFSAPATSSEVEYPVYKIVD